MEHAYNFYLALAVFAVQVLVGLSKQVKQIIQTEQNIVKNLKWLETNQLAIYERGRGFELGATNPGPPDYESDSQTTRPRFLRKFSGAKPNKHICFLYFAHEHKLSLMLSLMLSG